MRATAVRRTALAASVAALALLATACGGSEAGKDDEAKGGAKEGAAAKPAVKALTAAELEKATLVQGDVKAHKVEKAGPEDAVAAKDVTSDKEECAPLARAFGGAEEGKATAATKRLVMSEPEVDPAAAEGDAEDAFAAALDVTTTMLTLSSYDGATAEGNIAALRKAATDCTGGFTFSLQGEKQKITEITEAKATGGDEAAAWMLTVEQGGESMPVSLVAMRQGGTVATLTSINLAAMGGGKGTVELPAAVVAAQAAKLA